MLSLILNLLSLALLLPACSTRMFVATIQVLIYAGAVMVLFLFVVTMLTPRRASAWRGRDRAALAVGRGHWHWRSSWPAR